MLDAEHLDSGFETVEELVLAWAFPSVDNAEEEVAVVADVVEVSRRLRRLQSSLLFRRYCAMAVVVVVVRWVSTTVRQIAPMA